MKKASLSSLLTDSAVLAEMQGLGEMLEAAVSSGEAEQLDLLLHGQKSTIDSGAYTKLEAIILCTGRPALLIQDGKWQPSRVAEINRRLAPAAAALERIIPRVGRIEILNQEPDYLGTGWMLEED